MRFDSLREITASLLAETRKLAHLGITFKLERSTLADASKRRSEAIGDTDRKSTAVIRRGLKRKWSFSGLATMVRITLMYYVDFYSLFNNPEKEWESYCLKPRVRRLNHLFSIKGACKSEKNDSTALNQRSSHIFDQYLSFIGQQYNSIDLCIHKQIIGSDLRMDAVH